MTPFHLKNNTQPALRLRPRRAGLRGMLFALTALTTTGALASSATPGVRLDAVETDITAGFSPGGSAQNNVLATISLARQSIDVAAYSFTSKPIATALAQAKTRGIAVRVMADKKANSGRYTAVTYLANQGIPVRLNGHYAIMHNKFMVIDGKTVETGSFNYTASADKRNAENALVLWNAPALANQYGREFARLWDEATPLPAAY